MSWTELIIRVLVQFGVWLPVLVVCVLVANWDAKAERNTPKP